MSDCTCATAPNLPMPKDIVDLATPLFQACGGRLYRLQIQTAASAILMGDGMDVETRLNSLERAVQANTTTHFADTIAQRDQIGGLTPGDRCYVFDASSDPTVESGPAMYIWLPSRQWIKLYNGSSPLDCLNMIAKNGGLAVDADGKLYVDFSKAPASTIREVTKYIIQTGGGLAVGSDGKLYVNPGDLVLANGGLEARNGRLAVNAADLVKANGGLAVGSDGKLSVDFSKMPASEMQKSVLAMVQTGGGLGVDSNGKLFVDFTSMPTDKFEAMMKALRLPIWLTGRKNFYVNQVTGADTLDEGRGESAAKAFKTIQACINYVTDNYNMSRYEARIVIADGTYEESLSLPEFSRNTGYITMMSESGDNSKVVVVGRGLTTAPVTASGGLYYLRDITFDHRPDVSDLGDAYNPYSWMIRVTGGVTHCQGCVFRFAPVGEPAGHYSNCGLMAEGGGSLCLDPWTSANRFETGYDVFNENLEVYGLMADGMGSFIRCTGTDVEEYKRDLELNAVLTITARARGGQITYSTGRRYSQGITNSARASGKRFEVSSGGSIYVGGKGDEFFPGLNAGTVQAETFSWYR